VAVASINAAAVKLKRMNALLCTFVVVAIYPALLVGPDQFIRFSEKPVNAIQPFIVRN
jgi:hypothetical protein